MYIHFIVNIYTFDMRYFPESEQFIVGLKLSLYIFTTIVSYCLLICSVFMLKGHKKDITDEL